MKVKEKAFLKQVISNKLKQINNLKI